MGLPDNPYILEEIRRNAESKVRQFRDLFHYDKVPVDCYKLLQIVCQSRDDIEYVFLDNMSPAFDGKTFRDSYYGYLVCIKRPRGRSSHRFNFSIAHELGHIYLHHLDEPQEWKTWATLLTEEMEADAFAAELLMPREVMGYFRSIQEASYQLNVSEAAVRRRLKELNLKYTLRTCPECGFRRIPPAADYCRRCGHQMRSGLALRTEEAEKLFQQGKLMELFIKPHKEHKCICCEWTDDIYHSPVCLNCDLPMTNHCFREYNQEPHPCPADARYCEICGQETLYRDYIDENEARRLKENSRLHPR